MSTTSRREWTLIGHRGREIWCLTFEAFQVTNYMPWNIRKFQHLADFEDALLEGGAFFVRLPNLGLCS